MTRGMLLEFMQLLFGEEGPLHAAREQHGNALVIGGERNIIVADGYRLKTTGAEDQREVPLWFAHRVVAILHTYLDEHAPLEDAVRAYVEAMRWRE